MRKAKGAGKGERMKRKDNRGAAMVMVLCIMMVFMTLSLAILLAASAMVGTASKSAVSQRCKVAAVSYSKMLEILLAENEDSAGTKPMNDVQTFFAELIRKGKYEFIYDESVYETPEEWGKTRKIVCTMDKKESGAELSGYNIEMTVYWAGSREEIGEQIEDLTSLGEPTDQAYSSLRLLITVTCRKGKERYQITTAYTPNIVIGTGETAFWSFTPEGRK